ncbi:hypothetical protein NBRC10513_001487 [Rhodotorula toruloides]
MTRLVSPALRRAPSVPLACCCSCRSSTPAKARSAPPDAAPYSTALDLASTGQARPPMAPPPPYLFRHPGGFGFFSRSLPKKPPSPAIPPLQLDTPSFWVLHSTPQFQPDWRHSSFAAPPPPPPKPQLEPFDVRSWRPSSQSYAPPLLPSRATIAAGGLRRSMARIGGGKCVCGRVRHSCLRCRASSTSAGVGAAVQRRLEEEAAVVAAERRPEGDGSGSASASSGSDGHPPSRPTMGPSAQASAADRFHELLNREALGFDVRILPSPRGWTSPPSRTPSAATQRRKPIRDLSHDEARAALEPLVEAAQDADFLSALSLQQRVRLVASIGRVIRAVRPPSPQKIFPGLRDEGIAPEEEAFSELRHAAAEAMRMIMVTLPPMDSKEGGLVSASRQAALARVDIACLSDDVEAISASIEQMGKPGADELSQSISQLFRLRIDPLPTFDKPAFADKLHRQIEQAKTALVYLFEAWLRAPQPVSSHASSITALRLLHTHNVAKILDLLLPPEQFPSAGTERKQKAWNDILRRRYGKVLARSDPEPERWFEEEIANADPDELRLGLGFDPLKLGTHLVRHLARSGSALQALQIWKVIDKPLDELQSERLTDRLTEEEKIRTMTPLVHGLTQQRLYEDANRFTTELESLAKSLASDAKAAESFPDDPTYAGAPAMNALARNAFDVLAKLASDQGRAEIADRLLESLEGTGVDDKTTLKLSARRLRAKASRFRLEEAKEVFEQSQQGDASSWQQYRLSGQMALAHLKVNDVEGALKVVSEMLQAGLIVPLATINALMYGFARRGDVKSTYELFTQLSEGDFPHAHPTTSSWNALTKALQTERDTSSIEEIIRDMRRAGCRPDLETWTILLSAYVNNGQWTTAFALYRHLQLNADRTLQPDTVVYNVMLRACILAATPATLVLELFRDLIARGVRPNKSTYTLVLQSLCNAGLMDEAEDLFLILDRRQLSPHRPIGTEVIEPDQVLFTSMMAGYLRTGQREKADAMLTEMRVRGMKPGSHTLALLVAAKVSSLREQRDHVDPRALNALVKETRYFLKQNNIPSSIPQPIALDKPAATLRALETIYWPILAEFSRRGEADEAQQLIDYLFQYGGGSRGASNLVVSRIRLYTILMGTLRNKELSSSGDMAEETITKLYEIFQVVYAAVRQRFVRMRRRMVPLPEAEEGAEPVEVVEERVDPAQASILRNPLSIFLDTASRAGDHELIETTWRTLARQGFAFDSTNWNNLAMWFIQDLQLERAFWIVEHVLCRPFAPDGVKAGFDLEDQTAAFAQELASVTRASAFGRMSARRWAVRRRPDDEPPEAIDIDALLDDRTFDQPFRLSFTDGNDPRKADAQATRADVPEPQTTSSTEDSVDGEETEPEEAPRLGFADALDAGFREHTEMLWHPFSRTLAALNSALETLTEEGSVRVSKAYAEHIRKEEGIEVDDEERLRAALEARGELVDLDPEEARDAYRSLVTQHPHTVDAINRWRRRNDRLNSIRRRASGSQRYDLRM